MEIAIPKPENEKAPKPAAKPEDMAHKLVLDEVEETKWTSAKTASIAWRCMVLAGLMIAVFNSGSVLNASRKLPMGPMRIYGERAADTWHGWMTELGTTKFRETLHGTVQQWRTTPWPKLVWPERAEGEKQSIFPSIVPGSGDNPVKDALRQHVSKVIDNRRLVNCIQSKEYRDAVSHHYMVKRQMDDPGYAAVSRRTLETDPHMAKAAEEICGFRPSGAE